MAFYLLHNYMDFIEIIELLVSDTSLYQHFNEKNVATDNRK